MKSLIFLFSFSMACLHAISQDSLRATVYFIRRTGLNGFAEAYNVLIDNKQVCSLTNDRFSIHVVSEGVHEFNVREIDNKHANVDFPVSINLIKGNIYYFSLNFGEGAISKIQCAVIPADEAKTLLRNCIKKPQCQTQ